VSDFTRTAVYAEAPAIAEINALELAADRDEARASDTRWQQAERVVALLDDGWTQQEIADSWRRVDGSTYSQPHVSFVARIWRHYLGNTDRPRWNTAYHSDEFRVRPAVVDEDEGEYGDEDAIVKSDEWYTPGWLFDALGLTFDIDVCAPTDRTHVSTPARRFIDEHEDGLTAEWNGLVWCNPPYSSAGPWAQRMITHGNGLLLAHVPINGSWSLDCWRTCDAVTFFGGMHFVRPDGTEQRPAWWLQLVAWGPTATAALHAMPDRLDDLEERWRPGPIWTVAA
jgi:hypothetical protein